MKKDQPISNGSSNRFLMKPERLIFFECVTSDSAFLTATIAERYFMKSTPHLSQVPPCRCLLWHDGHSKSSVAWQRGQNRAVSLASDLHLGHCMGRFYRVEGVSFARGRACCRLTITCTKGQVKSGVKLLYRSIATMAPLIISTMH